MLVPIKLTEEKEITYDETSLSDTTFKVLGLREEHIEEFLRKNINVLFAENDDDEDQTLIIVGQQVVNASRGRNDLVALDGSGNLVLIEIKRDAEDMAARSEPMELQAVRYAASLATIDNDDTLVDKIFANYIEKTKTEIQLEGLTPKEFARRTVKDFLKKNEAEGTFNKKQRIILVASDFDEQTLSATAWMSKNGIDISCIRIRPKEQSKPDKDTTDSSENTPPSRFLEITRLIPPRTLEGFFIPFPDPSGGRGPISQTGAKKRSFAKMPELIEWGIIKTGDKLKIKGRDDSEAKVVDAHYVEFKGETLSYNNWGRKVTGWSTINIYDWAVNEDGKTLAALRDAKVKEQALANG